MDGARKARPGRDLVGELLAIVEQPEGDVLTPEHALGEEPDARTVVYAAGARLYEPPAGPPHFAGRTRGELAAARIQAETLAKAYPHDGRTFALLGHVLFAQGEKLRALAAYREAHHLDPSVGAAPELLANLRATFADPEHGEAAFRLAEAIGPPAKPILSDLAAHTSEARLKRRAAEASGRITRGEKSP